MSFKAYFYSFSKRENSTARPTGDGTDFDIAIKFPSGVLNPVIELMTSTNMSSYNYCKIPHFDNRYYFVSDWVSDHDRWIAHLKVDVLATYKTEIKASTQFVLRSASKSNRTIPDAIYPVSTQKSLVNTAVNNPLKINTLTQDFDYILGILNQSDSAPKINGIQYMKLTGNQMRNFTHRMLYEDYFGIDTVLADFGFNIAFLHCVVNPAQYIVESYMLPPTSTLFTVDTTDFTFGPWQLTNFTSYKALNRYGAAGTESYSTGSTAIELPQHPQISDHGVWVNSAPYTEHVLHAGVFGDIPLTFATSQYSMKIRCIIKMDFKGNARLEVQDENGRLLATASANIAIQVPVVATSEKTMQGMSKLGNTISNGTLSMGMSAASAGGDFTETIIDCIPQQTASSGVEGMLPLTQDWWVQSKFQYVSGNMAEGGALAGGQLGYPLCEDITLSNLSGYCKCGDVDISLAAYDSEISQVRSLMQSGFFLED